MKQYLLIIACLIFLITHVYSGEVAQYKIVGISRDSQYLAFAEYGIDEENHIFANMSIVDIPQNAFIANGIRQNVYDVTVHIDQDGINALLQTVAENTMLLRQYNIDLLNSGKLIYILLNGNEAPNSILFTDHESDISYSATLSQHIKTTTNGQRKTSGAFNITAAITHDDNTTTLSIGSSEHYRANVKNYLMRAVYTTQDNTSLIFIIEKHMTSDASKDDIHIYYMVETARWRK